jgi:hypothetical protein
LPRERRTTPRRQRSSRRVGKHAAPSSAAVRLARAGDRALHCTP